MKELSVEINHRVIPAEFTSIKKHCRMHRIDPSRGSGRCMVGAEAAGRFIYLVVFPAIKEKGKIQRTMSDFLMDDGGQVREAKYRSASSRRTADTTSRTVAASDPSRVSTIAVRPRTKYEQSIMDRIPERQKANLVQPQSYGGNVYTGIGFLPNPGKVQFIDFAVGETLKQTVQLTNVSQGFNAFKVLPAPALFRDVLEVVYTPQSMMSAGMSCSITIVFTPKENVDIDTEITLQAQTGFISIPVVCRRKRAQVSCSSNKLDFGSIVVAETATRVTTFKNDGALGVKMTIGGDVLELLHATHADSDGNRRPFLLIDPEIHPTKATVVSIKPFSSVVISLRFAPQELVTVDSSIYFSFDNPEVDDVVVFVAAQAVDVPVFVSKNSVLNFDCCFYGTLYRDTVTVQNTLASAVKVTPEVPPALRGMLEYVPKFGFVQPSASFDFQVKFTPNEGLGREVDSPVKITVTDQTMPIFYQIRASLTRLGISFSPPELQLGVCSVGEMIQQPLKVTNCSRISKKIGFVKLPENVKILPFDVLEIAPDETVDLLVCVAPPTQGQFTQSLQLATQYNETHCITLTGHGKAQCLVFGTPMIQLPVCTIGRTTSASTQLVNKSASAQRFAFAVNKAYGVDISPSNGIVEKGQSVSVVVSFSATQTNVDLALPPLPENPTETPPANADDNVKGKGAAAPKKKTKAEEEQDKKERERVEEEKRIERENVLAERERLAKEFEKMEPWEESQEDVEGAWSRHRTLLIPCYVEGWSGVAVMLGLRCTVVKPTLVVSLPSSEVDAAEALTARSDQPTSRASPPPVPSSALALNFGEVPADHCSSKTVVLHNLSRESVPLSLELLDPFGAFRVARPPPVVLKGGAQCEVVVQFRPTNKAVYAQQLVVNALGANAVAIDVVGEGLPAALSISQDKQNPNAGSANQAEIALPMGYTLIGDKVEVPLFFSNFSPFPLHVTSSFLARHVRPFNTNGTIPFSLTPKQLVVPANGKVEVMASFTPLVEGPCSASCEVEFGGDRMKKTLIFEGFGCEKGIQVVFPANEQNTTQRGPFTAFGDLPLTQGASISAPVLVNFTSVEQKPVQQVIFVVNNKGGNAGDYSIEGLLDADVKNGWKVDPVKANVAPGTKATVTITFSPTQLLLDSLPIPKVSVISLCNLKLIVKGGMPASDVVHFVRCKGTACR